MPIIQVQLLEGRSIEQKRRFAEEVTAVACSCLNTRPEQVRIILNEMPPSNFAIAGTLMTDKK